MEPLVFHLARPTELEAAARGWAEERSLVCGADGATLVLSVGNHGWRRFQCTRCGVSSHLFRTTQKGRFEVTPLKRFAEKL